MYEFLFFFLVFKRDLINHVTWITSILMCKGGMYYIFYHLSPIHVYCLVLLSTSTSTLVKLWTCLKTVKPWPTDFIFSSYRKLISLLECAQFDSFLNLWYFDGKLVKTYCILSMVCLMVHVPVNTCVCTKYMYMFNHK